jgi:hypothetical protein
MNFTPPQMQQNASDEFTRFLGILITEQTLCTSETITQWALASNRQRTVSYTCMIRDWLLQQVQTTSYRTPVSHISRLMLSRSLKQRESFGWQRNSENDLNLASKSTYASNIFLGGTKSLLTSVICDQLIGSFRSPELPSECHVMFQRDISDKRPRRRTKP